jgi:hypothetical protein
LIIVTSPPNDGVPGLLLEPPVFVVVEPLLPPIGLSIDVAEHPTSRPRASQLNAPRRTLSRERHLIVIELREGFAAMTGRWADQ